MQRHFKPALVATLPLFLLTFSSPEIARAETLQTADYIAVAFEVEDFDTKTDRWVVTDSSTPVTTATNPDPDGNHSDQASEGVYLEVLPDYRVTEHDEFHPSGSLWGPYDGPRLTYTINFPEAGQYYAHIRAYSTGAEDNGAHIGINGDFPPQARRVQWCGGKHNWTWSSAQRDSGGNGSCGREKTVWLDVPSAGNHQIMLASREDGAEFDRVVLIKDLTGNTKVCEPNGATQISCKAGAIESEDGIINLRLKMESDVNEAVLGDTANVDLTLENLDAFDHATDIEVAVELDEDLGFVSASSHCTHNAGVVTCTHDDLEPTAPDEWEEYAIEVVVEGSGALDVTATATADETDANPNNATTDLTIIGVSNLVDVDLSLEASSSSMSVNKSDSVVITIEVSNDDTSAANDVDLTFTPDAGSVVGVLPDPCVASNPVTCALGVIEAGESVSLEIPLDLNVAGTRTHVASVDSDNESNPGNNTQTLLIEVFDPDAEPTTTTGGDTTTGETDSGSADGATDGSTGGETGSTTDGDADTTAGGQDDGGMIGGTTGDTSGDATGGDSTTGSNSAGDDTGGADTGATDGDGTDSSGSGIGGTSGGTTGETDSGNGADGGTGSADAGDTTAGGVTGGTAQANSGSSSGGGALGLVWLAMLLVVTPLARVGSGRLRRRS